MFFLLSKLFWAAFAPSHLIVWLSIAAAFFLLTDHYRAGRYFAVASSAMLIFIGVLPAFYLLARPIEFQYARPSHLPARIDGILILGGGRDDRFRLSAAYALAREYPDAKVVYSGGSNSLTGNQPGNESRRASRFLVDLGLDPKRLVLEGRSRNTWENFLFTQRLVKPQESQIWMLATSALQMPRAMEIAHRLNWKFLPWPTDWVSGRGEVYGYLRISDNLWAFDEAAREWIGLFAYRWSGRAVTTSGNR